MNMEQRRYLCPALPLGSCDWGGPSEDLSFHFAVSHPLLRIQKSWFHNKYDLAWTNGSIHLQDNSEENRLLIYSEDIFLFQLKVDLTEEKLWAGIRHVGKIENAAKFQYQLRIESENCFIKSEKTGVVQLDNDWGFNIKEMLEFDLSPITRTEIKNIQYHLRIYYPDRNTSFIISELKCVMCKSNFSPPAFACQMGHTVCIHCKKSDNHCGHVASVPCSLIVEDISLLVRYPCKNESFGCDLVIPKSKIRFHEKECFVLTSCFAEERCQYVGVVYKWWYHLQEKHPEMISVIHQDHWYDVRETHCQTIFIRKKGVFRILSERKRAGDPFLWSCQQLGLKPGDEPQFELYVKAVDPKNPKAKLIGTVSCCSLIQPEDEATEHYIAPVDILQPFVVTDNKICIRLYLRRVEK